MDGVSPLVRTRMFLNWRRQSIAGGGPFGVTLNRHAQTVWVAVRLIWELLSRSK